MKSGKIIIIAPIVLLLLIVVNIVVLAKLHPYRPGDALFGLQSAVENTQLKLKSDPQKQIEFSFELVERRLDDLAMVNQQEDILPTVVSFEQAITTAILNIQYLDRDSAHIYYHNIKPLMRRIEQVVTNLEIRFMNAHLAYLKNKISVLKNTTSPVELVKLVSENYLSRIFFTYNDPNLAVESMVVKQEPLKHKSMHSDAPNCMDCHQDGEYMDSASECSNCHIPEVYFESRLGTDSYRPKYLEQDYPYHFSGDCIDCHRTKSWRIYQFDHREVYTCLCCHVGDYPTEDLIESSNQILLASLSTSNRNTMVSPHYPGDCAICHTDTTDWGVNGYDHQLETCDGCHGLVGQLTDLSETIEDCTRETNCNECHIYERHPYEYGNFCARCHQDVLDWRNVSLDHAGFSTCIGCHSKDIPSANHFSGDCVQCHSTSAWGDVLMNHGPQGDCMSCHEAPADHADQGFTAQCSTCHNTTTWNNAVFNHTLSNCSTCHSTPDNHYPAACVSCHFTNSWSLISVNHSTLFACTDCHTAPVNHYVGLCSNCHNAFSWSDVTYNHTGYTYCSTCHTPPPGHYPGECSNCHTTSSWSKVSFDHTGYTDCTSCHTAPSGHYPGECVLCHNTFSWSDVNFNHSGYTNCSTCHNPPPGHYPGECTLCHKTTTWSDVTFNHTGYTNCSSCHTSPAGHYPGECSLCHNTTSWSQVSFDHTGYTNCSSCHTRPPKHPGAQCSQCHTTDTWEIP
jgi:hypothetical protein